MAPAATPVVSIVILTWNGLALTKACLTSIRNLTRGVDYRIVVVDNGSTDGTREWLRTLDGITLIENATNEGFVRGNNRALREIPADHDVVLLNNDVEVLQADWLQRLRDVANSDPAFGVLGCRMIFPDGRLLHTGTVIPLDTFHGFQVGSNQVDIGQYPGVKEVEGVVGACLYIRSDARKSVGLLSEDYESYFEDTDYCLRAREAGYKVVCVNDVCVVHHVGSSTKEKPEFLSAVFTRSRDTFIRKWGAHLRGRFTRRLTWRSRVHEALDWAPAARDLVLALDAADVDVALEHIDGAAAQAIPFGDPRIDQLKARAGRNDDVEIIFGPFEQFRRHRGKYRIGFTVPRDAAVSPSDLECANIPDEVWVPSRAARDALVAAGCKRPVHVVPLGINPDFFHPGIRGERSSERFTFLATVDGSLWRGGDVVLKAYAAAFGARDDVLLLVNCMATGADAQADQAAAPVAVLNRPCFLFHEMPALLKGADCFVMPSRFEGFGLSALEAMACGLPVIATASGGLLEFMTEANSYLVHAERGEERLAEMMRHVYEHRDEAAARGRRAALDAAAGWTWRHTAQRIIERLDAAPVT